jgi:phosphate transport system substrate-binding protein
LAISACSIAAPAKGAALGSPPVVLSGAGSTFDAPFFTRAFAAYERHHNVKVGYQAVGSGAGIQNVISGSVDFGASDVPMNHSELSAARANVGTVEQVPITLGGVAVGYNVAGVSSGLRLTGPVLADIFLGRITTWNAPEIAALNPGIKLPSFGISVIHRLDSSGTTYIFSDYLSRVSPSWKTRVGTGKLLTFPVGLPGYGNDGVAALLQTVPGSIGYLELAYVLKYHVTDAKLKNASGRYVLPTQASVAAAAAALPKISAARFSIVNAPGPPSYPIGGYSWVLIRQTGPKASALTSLFRWMVTTGQTYAGQLDYVPLPARIQRLAMQTLGKVR